MPTRIVMANGEQISVTPEIEAVAEQLASGALTRFDRPWGDTAIYVNPSEIAYLEGHQERNPNIEALEATVEAETRPAGGPLGGAAAGGPAAPHPGGPPNPP